MLDHMPLPVSSLHFNLTIQLGVWITSQHLTEAHREWTNVILSLEKVETGWRVKSRGF